MLRLIGRLAGILGRPRKPVPAAVLRLTGMESRIVPDTGVAPRDDWRAARGPGRRAPPGRGGLVGLVGGYPDRDLAVPVVPAAPDATAAPAAPPAPAGSGRTAPGRRSVLELVVGYPDRDPAGRAGRYRSVTFS
jgi:hypothetical protein